MIFGCWHVDGVSLAMVPLYAEIYGLKFTESGLLSIAYSLWLVVGFWWVFFFTPDPAPKHEHDFFLRNLSIGLLYECGEPH